MKSAAASEPKGCPLSEARQAKRILLTGSAGSIGRCVGPTLVERGHDVLGYDLLPTPTLAQAVVGDLTDRAALDRAMAGRDTLIHLAAYPHGHGDFLADMLQPNFVGLYQTFEAAKAAGVKRIILASTMQVISGLTQRRDPDRPISVADGVAPTNHYALGKIWAEHYGEMVARREGTSVIAVRIAWFPRTTAEIERMRGRAEEAHFSHDDTRRFFACAVEAADFEPRFVILFGVGRTDHFDLETSRRLIGYEPLDTYPDGCQFPL